MFFWGGTGETSQQYRKAPQLQTAGGFSVAHSWKEDRGFWANQKNPKAFSLTHLSFPGTQDENKNTNCLLCACVSTSVASSKKLELHTHLFLFFLLAQKRRKGGRKARKKRGQYSRKTILCFSLPHSDIGTASCMQNKIARASSLTPHQKACITPVKNSNSKTDHSQQFLFFFDQVRSLTYTNHHHARGKKRRGNSKNRSSTSVGGVFGKKNLLGLGSCLSKKVPQRTRGGKYIDTLSFLFRRKLTRLYSGTVVFQLSYA